MGAGLLLVGIVQECMGRLEADMDSLEADMESLEAHTSFAVLLLAQVGCEGAYIPLGRVTAFVLEVFHFDPYRPQGTVVVGQKEAHGEAEMAL